MKPIKAFLLSPLLTIIFSFALNGCYTQFAFVDDEQYSAAEPSLIIIYPPIIMPVVPRPICDPPSPVFNPLPPTGYSPIVTEPQSPPRTRDSGYRRSGQSENPQTPSLVTEIRTSGPKRGGR